MKKKKKPIPDKWTIVFESVSEPGIIYGSCGKFPNHELERLGPMSEFSIKKHSRPSNTKLSTENEKFRKLLSEAVNMWESKISATKTEYSIWINKVKSLMENK